LFAPEPRRQVIKQIVGAASDIGPTVTRAQGELREAERRISRLVDGIEAGAVDPCEVAGRLKGLRQQRDIAKAELEPTQMS
jgi:hypothetical protein